MKSGTCVIEQYINAKTVCVSFPSTGYKCTTRMEHLRSGKVKDPYAPNVSGVGYIGCGVHRPDERKVSKRKTTVSYSTWSGMLDRCYTREACCYHRYGGRGIVVHPSWFNFQIFSEWFHKNYKEGFQLDKDLKIIDCRVYSENTCSFVPKQINTILSSSNSRRGVLPVGVYRNRQSKYQARCSRGGGSPENLGVYNTPEGAFRAYKTFKESHVKKVAQYHYDLGEICEQVYTNLMNWEAVPFPD